MDKLDDGGDGGGDDCRWRHTGSIKLSQLSRKKVKLNSKGVSSIIIDWVL